MEKMVHDLEKKIVTLTEIIRTKYPEVYRSIEEMPITIPNVVSPEVNIKQLEDYLESLTALIKTHSSS